MIRKLSEAECSSAIKKGDFDPALVSGPAVAVILTQSWCPQWAVMKAYLPKVDESLKEVKIFYVEYDIEKWESFTNEAFMAFKEDTFKNREIPYVRYYVNGIFNRDSNFISLEGFISRLNAI